MFAAWRSEADFFGYHLSTERDARPDEKGQRWWRARVLNPAGKLVPELGRLGLCRTQRDAELHAEHIARDHARRIGSSIPENESVIWKKG